MQGVYLLHFSPPFKHAKHYLGYADDIYRRLYKHEFGKSDAKLVKAATNAGVTILIARVWQDKDRSFERHLKGRKLLKDGSRTHHKGSLKKHCPICQKENANVSSKP